MHLVIRSDTHSRKFNEFLYNEKETLLVSKFRCDQCGRHVAVATTQHCSKLQLWQHINL